MHKSAQLERESHILVFLIGILVLIGTIFIYSSSAAYATELFGDPHYFVRKQLFGMLAGICALCAIQYIPVHLIKRYAPIILFSALGITALTLVSSMTRTIHGSSRWLRIAGFSFQPSELLKVALMIYLASFLARHSPRSGFMHGFLPLMLALFSAAALLLLQPDFGLTVTLIATAFMLVFIAKFQLKYLYAAALCAIPAATSLILLRPYRLQRILTYLNPWNDPKGAGFQVIQSLIAIGSGGIWGVGVAHSKQKFFYLPMQHTDFIFSIIAEETGFIGCSLVVLAYLSILYCCIRIAQRLSDPFAQFFVIGFAILINLQAVINLCVASGLAPTKGIGLPFVSYGNTALVCHLMMVGIIMHLIRTGQAAPKN